ncbi:hypothetical protein GCM10022235_77470 [Kribbella ginsengisoli]|uniref:Uncharacterized protein n=1 Tax=Kribbella ginsengisoli TaxID=363865 RepID=A0ABP6Z0D9_9ACTN
MRVMTRPRRRSRPSYFLAISAWSETGSGAVDGVLLVGTLELGLLGPDVGVLGVELVGGVGSALVVDEHPTAATSPRATTPSHGSFMFPIVQPSPRCST